MANIFCTSQKITWNGPRLISQILASQNVQIFSPKPRHKQLLYSPEFIFFCQIATRSASTRCFLSSVTNDFEALTLFFCKNLVNCFTITTTLNWFHVIFLLPHQIIVTLDFLFSKDNFTKFLSMHLTRRRNIVWRFLRQQNQSKLSQFYNNSELISRNISPMESGFVTVFGMSEISWYNLLLFWAFFEEEPKWKNFKTLPDATFFQNEVTKPLSSF